MVFTATISQSVLLRVDLTSRALYTMPNSPAMELLLLSYNVSEDYVNSFGELEMTEYIQVLVQVPSEIDSSEYVT